MSWLKNRIVWPFIGAIILGLLVNIVLPLKLQSFVSLVLFVLLADIMFEQLEKDAPLKRGLGRLFKLFEAAMFFLAYRIILGYLIKLPAVGTWGELFNKDAEGIASAQNWILEIIILIIGLKLTKMTIFQKKTWVANAAVLISFLFILWSVKQPYHTQSYGHTVQASIRLDTTKNNYSARAKDATANNIWAIVISKTPAYKLEFHGDEVTTVTKTAKMFDPGDIVRIGNQGDNFYAGQAFTRIEIMVDGDKGKFLVRQRWVKAEDLEQLDPAKTKVKEGQYAIVRDKNSWTIYFLTNEAITVDDFPLAAYFIINGVANGIINEAPLESPTRENLGRFCSVPLGQRVRLQDTRVGMVLKAYVGTKVTINFV